MAGGGPRAVATACGALLVDDDAGHRHAEGARDRDDRGVGRIAAAALDEAHVGDGEIERLGERLLGEAARAALLANAVPQATERVAPRVPLGAGLGGWHLDGDLEMVLGIPTGAAM